VCILEVFGLRHNRQMAQCRLSEMTQNHVELEFQTRTPEDLQQRALEFYQQIKTRRSVRDFAATPVPKDVIENVIRAAGTAPNGANLQFCGGVES
jgi:Nitroreductase family